jgi:syntaxin 1B/2/3
MNNLLSESWRNEDIETGNHGGMVELTDSSSLDGFFKEADAIRSNIEEIKSIRKRLHESNEAAKSLHAASAVRSLRGKMDADVALVLKKARFVKAQLGLLEQAAESSRALPGSGPGSSDDRTRTSVLGGLKSKLKGSMDAFVELRKEITTEYRETVARR